MARFDILKETLLSAVAAPAAAEAAPAAGAARRLFPREMVDELWERQGGACALCAQGIDAARRGEPDYAQIDHAVPFVAGGATEPGNAQLVHAACNRSKGARAVTVAAAATVPDGIAPAPASAPSVLLPLGEGPAAEGALGA